MVTSTLSVKNHLAPVDRLNYSGDLAPIIDSISKAYDIGVVRRFSVIEVGYEDCNVRIETSCATFVAKMFNKTRTLKEIERNMMIMREVIKAGVRHPRLILTTNGDDVFTTRGVTLTLMEYIHGKTFFELNRAPTEHERRAIIEETAKINAIALTPDFTFDSWAIPHIHSMYDRVREFIDPSDMPLVKKAIARYDALSVHTLPHAFVHGDLTKANIIKVDDTTMYIIDFSEANSYPRIQELAVIIANLLYERDDTRSLKEKCNMVAAEYAQYNALTKEELRCLPDYALAGVAMEFMGAHQEKYINGNDTAETGYWLDLGREGLRGAL